MYSKIAVQLSRLQALKGPLSLYAAFSGQWAFNSFISIRAHLPLVVAKWVGVMIAELIGDKGAAGTLELRYDLGVDKFYFTKFATLYLL